MKGSIASIETFGVLDGPGIRTVVFLNGCNLRCIYCHNPEMFKMGNKNMTVDELYQRIIRNKEYFGEYGGVTFSGGEPLLQQEFLINICKKLKNDNIHIALDTAGNGLGNYEELLKYIDLIILDIKYINKDGYKLITGGNIKKTEEFIQTANKLNKKFWIRQVVVPGIMNNDEYIKNLSIYLKKINNILKIEFLPYHKLGREKYLKIGLDYKCENIPEMDKTECDKLFDKFMNYYKEN